MVDSPFPACCFPLPPPQRDPSARPTAEELLRHPFVTAPLTRQPAPPALFDPLSYLAPYDNGAAVPGRSSGSIGGAVGAGTPPLTPLRIALSGPSAGGARSGGVAMGVSTPTAAGSPMAGWQQQQVAATAFSGALGPGLWNQQQHQQQPGGFAGANGQLPYGNLAGGMGGMGIAGAGGPMGLGPVGLGTAGGLAGGVSVGVGAVDEDQLAALVLGNSVHISKGARAAQAVAADDDRWVCAGVLVRCWCLVR